MNAVDRVQRISKKLFPLGEGIFDRGDLLYKSGLNAARVLWNYCANSSLFCEEDDPELRCVYVERAKERLGQAFYCSEFLTERRSLSYAKFEESGNYWDRQICSYARKVEHKRGADRVAFQKFLSSGRAEISTAILDDFVSRSSNNQRETKISLGNSKRSKLEYITKRVEGIGIQESNYNSKTNLATWSTELTSELSVSLVLDTVTIPSGSSYSDCQLDFSYAIFPIGSFETNNFSFEPCHITLPEDWFPVSLTPFISIYKHSPDPDHFEACLDAHLVLFSIVRDTARDALVT